MGLNKFVRVVFFSRNEVILLLVHKTKNFQVKMAGSRKKTLYFKIKIKLETRGHDLQLSISIIYYFVFGSKRNYDMSYIIFGKHRLCTLLGWYIASTKRNVLRGKQ